MLPKDFPYKILLASASQRRRDLLKGLGFEFEAVSLDADESYPNSLPIDQIAEHIAKAKSLAYDLGSDKKGSDKKTLLITADTIVALDGKIFGKPKDRAEAIEFLSKLSGHTHIVYTGVCLRSLGKTISFTSSSKVSFRNLKRDEIEYYIDTYKPYDKAGAYGMQEWIGFVGVKHIEGSFFNVMGLPTQKLYTVLELFAKTDEV